MLADDYGMAGAMQVHMANGPGVLCSFNGANCAQGFRYAEMELQEFNGISLVRHYANSWKWQLEAKQAGPLRAAQES